MGQRPRCWLELAVMSFEEKGEGEGWVVEGVRVVGVRGEEEEVGRGGMIGVEGVEKCVWVDGYVEFHEWGRLGIGRWRWRGGWWRGSWLR